GGTATYTFVYLQPRGTATGLVTDNGLIPAGLGGIRVGTKNSDGTWAVTTLTLADGTFSLRLPVGTWTVYVDNSTDGRYHAPGPVANVVIADGGTVTGVNFTFNRWDFFTGELDDTAGAGVVGAIVSAYSIY